MPADLIIAQMYVYRLHTLIAPLKNKARNFLQLPPMDGMCNAADER